MPRLVCISWFLLILAAPLSAQEPSPRIEVDSETIDLGALVVGTRGAATFVVSNPGGATLELHRVVASCVCAAVEYDPSIPAGGSGEIRVEITTWDLFGPGGSDIVVRTNDPARPVLKLRLDADVVHKVRAHPDRLRWSSVRGEADGVLATTVWAQPGEVLAVTGVEGAPEGIRAVVREARPEERRPEGGESQWVVEATLDRWAPVGAIEGELWVTTDHPDQPRLRVAASGFMRPRFLLSPPVADFGEIVLDRDKNSRYHFKSFTTQPITITKVSTDVPGLNARMETEDGREYFIFLLFTSDMADGPFQGELLVETTEAADAPTIRMSVSGTILRPDPEAEPATDS